LPRCKKHRCCRRFENEIIYKPVAIPLSELGGVLIELDEFEAMRLCDLEGLDQTEAGAIMNVSRGTIQRLLANGRRKLLEGFLNGVAIRINQPTRSEEK
jgi:uncharacterized protein